MGALSRILRPLDGLGATQAQDAQWKRGFPQARGKLWLIQGYPEAGTPVQTAWIAAISDVIVYCAGATLEGASDLIMPSPDPIALANELHDGVIQELSALLLQMETYERRLKKDPPAASEDLQRMKDQTRATLNQLRQLVTRLREMERSNTK